MRTAKREHNFHHEDRKRLRQRLPELIAGAYLVVSTTWILVSSRFLPLPETEAEAISWTRLSIPIGIIGITGFFLWLAVRTHTRRMIQKETDLLASREKYRSLFTSIQEPILIAGPTRRILDCNPAFEKLFGYTLEEVEGKKISWLYQRKEQYQVLKARLENQTPDERLTETIIYRKKDQVSFPGRTIISRLTNASGETTGLIQIIRDLSSRYAAQIVLAEQEDEYIKFIEHAPVGVFETTSLGQVLDINLKMAEILGYSSREEAIKAYTDLKRDLYVDPTRRRQFLELLEEQGQVEDFIYQAYRKDGSRIWISMNARILPKTDDDFYLIHGFATDVTEQFQAERALKENEARYRQHLERTFDGVVIYRESTILFINQQGAEVLGAAGPEQIIGQEIWDIMPEDLIEPTRKRLERMITGEETEFHGENIITLSGESKNIEYLALPITYEGKNAVQVVFRDITQQKRMQGALLAERDRAQRYLDISGVMIVAVNLNGKVTMINEAGCDILGYPRDQLLGEDWFETILPPETEGKERSGIKRLLSGEIEELQGRRSPVLTRSGEERIIQWHHVALLDDHQQVTGTLSSGQDVTERIHTEHQLASYQSELEILVEERTRELEKRVAEVETLNKALTNLLEDLQVTNQKLEKATSQLQEANKELESFTYSVSHDLRAPLRAVTGFSTILDEEIGPQLPEGAARHLHLIQENARQMEHLIQDLLALSRFGSQSVMKTQIDLNQLVNDLLIDLVPENHERDIEIKIDRLPPCRVDPGLIKQVFANLIDNALKYTKNNLKTRIQIKAEEKSKEIIFSVKDNGVGFSMQYKDKLFGTFQRLHRTEDYPGTGVGLAIVKRIIHKHGGRVWAEGEEGEGAEFFFSIPRTD